MKQSSTNWFDTLKAGLKSRYSKNRKWTQVFFLRKGAIVLVYVDDCIIVSKDSQTIEDLVISLKNGPENFLLTDEGNIENYLGVYIRPFKGDTFELCQP